MLSALVRTDSSPAQFFIRLALGCVIFPHGAQKVFGWFGGSGYLATIESFAAMGIPAWATILLMAVEVGGAGFLVIGFLTRFWALAIGGVISACMFANHLQHGFFMNWSGKLQGEGYEYHLLVIGICLALLIRGGGLLSVDRLFTKDRRRGGIVF
ncbi:MAG: DoxX family protein [Desulfobulbaceae bacterium]|nr:DoxX family protein [Desulfobulbaceae bacterium]HIJ79158.1 DoxX family protein [Deltaproteobacteria bacterium]